MYRVKAVLGALGFDVSGSLEVEPEDLRDKRAIVELREEMWEEPETGKRHRRMTVTYLGFERAPEPVVGEHSFSAEVREVPPDVSAVEVEPGAPESVPELPPALPRSSGAPS